MVCWPKMDIRSTIWYLLVQRSRITVSILQPEGQTVVSFLLQMLVPLFSAVSRCLRRWVKPDNRGPLVNPPLDLTRSKADLIIENSFLRHQLVVLHRQVKRPRLRRPDRFRLVLPASCLRGWKQALLIVQPETLLRWHRELFRRVWRRKSRAGRKPGRPPLSESIVSLVVQMAQENRTWGVERIRGELLRLGITLSKMKNGTSGTSTPYGAQEAIWALT